MRNLLCVNAGSAVAVDIMIGVELISGTPARSTATVLVARFAL